MVVELPVLLVFGVGSRMTGSCICYIKNSGSLSETSSLTPHILLKVTSRNDHSTRGTVGAGVD